MYVVSNDRSSHILDYGINFLPSSFCPHDIEESGAYFHQMTHLLSQNRRGQQQSALYLMKNILYNIFMLMLGRKKFFHFAMNQKVKYDCKSVANSKPEQI